MHGSFYNSTPETKTTWSVIEAMLLTKDPNDKLVPAITGNESETELRENILHIIENCSAVKNHPHCPFRLLGNIPPYSAKNLVDALKHQNLLSLFEAEHQCRINYGAKCQK